VKSGVPMLWGIAQYIVINRKPVVVAKNAPVVGVKKTIRK